MQYATKFGSLDALREGRHRAHRRRPEALRLLQHLRGGVGGRSPYEKVAVGKNMQYVLEVLRAEGTSAWRTCAHDEFALVLDGEVEVAPRQARPAGRAAGQEGLGRASTASRRARRWGASSARRGHMALLPANAAYRFHADRPGVILLQTILGDDTVERWAEICLS